MKGSVRNMNNVQNEIKAVTKEKGGTANGKIVFFHSMRFKLLLFVVIALAAMTVVSFMSLVPGFRKTFKYRELFNRQCSSDRKWT